MRDLLGVIYVVVVMLAVGYVLYDPSANQLKHISRNEVAMVMLAMGIAMLGFMFITGKGFANKPRPSRYR